MFNMLNIFHMFKKAEEAMNMTKRETQHIKKIPKWHFKR